MPTYQSDKNNVLYHDFEAEVKTSVSHNGDERDRVVIDLVNECDSKESTSTSTGCDAPVQPCTFQDNEETNSSSNNAFDISGLSKKRAALKEPYVLDVARHELDDDSGDDDASEFFV